MKKIEDTAKLCGMLHTQEAVREIKSVREQECERIRVKLYAPSSDLLASVLAPLGKDQKYVVTLQSETMQVTSTMLRDLLNTEEGRTVSILTQTDAYDLHCTTRELTRGEMLGSDKVVFLIDAAHALDIRQQKLLRNLRGHVSNQRLYLSFCNVDNMHLDDWDAQVQRIALYSPGTIICVTTTDNTPSKLRAYMHLHTPELFQQLQHDTLNPLEVRRITHLDSQSWLEGVCQGEMAEMRHRIQVEQQQMKEQFASYGQQVDHLMQARQRLLQQVNLFVDDAVRVQLIREIESFATALKASVRTDIMNSADIKHDLRYLNQYLTHVWKLFFEQNSARQQAVFTRQAELLDTQMNHDLSPWLQEVPQPAEEQRLGEGNFYNSSVRISRRRSGSGVNSLSDSMNATGILLALLSSMTAGLTVILGGVLMKVVMKGKLIDELKQDMVKNADAGIDKVAASLAQQIRQRYEELAGKACADYAQAYDEAIEVVLQKKDSLRTQMEQNSAMQEAIEGFLMAC